MHWTLDCRQSTNLDTLATNATSCAKRAPTHQIGELMTLEKPSLKLTELSNEPLRHRIAAVLREGILSGDLLPGQALTEMQIASQLGVSRAPVREAIRILSKDGLVESVPYRGTTVRKLSRQDIEEVYSLRLLLETFALRRIIGSDLMEDVEPLKRICRSMEDHARARDLKGLNLDDEAFHETIIQSANHRLLASIWSGLGLRVRQAMSLRNQEFPDPAEVALNHRPIVAALEAKDLDLAIRLLEDHIRSGAELYVEAWANADDDGHDG